MTTPLETALTYIARNWTPVPVAHRAKKPIGDGWQHRRIDASNAPQYFNGTAMNIGVQLGRASGGLVDVDLDCGESLFLADAFLPATDAIFGGDQTSIASALCVEHLRADRQRGPLQYKDSEAKTEAMLVELRVGGGDRGAQSVFPGSTHESGEPIAWATDGEPAPINGELLSRQVARLACACLIVRRWPAEGGRHDLGLTVGGFLARAGWSEPEVTHFVEVVAKAVRDPQWKDRVTAARDQWRRHKENGKGRGLPALIAAVGEKAATTIAKWLNYSEAEPVFAETPLDPWEQFIVPPFPMDVFNEPIRKFVETKSRVIGVDPAALAMCVLANFSGAIDHRFRLRMKLRDDWVVTPRIWALLVGDPSVKKSPAIDAATRPLRKIENEVMRLWQMAAAATAKDQQPPPQPRSVYRDTTIEKLSELLANNPRAGGLVIRDEMSGFFGDRRYNSSKLGSSDRAFWLEAYNGGPFSVDRIKRGSLRIDPLSLSVLGGAQPDRLREILPTLTSDGLLQRFLPIMMKSANFGTDEGADDSFYSGATRYLHGLAPQTFMMSEAAHAVAEAARRRLFELEGVADCVAPGFQAFIGKMAGTLGSLTLILHLVTYAPFLPHPPTVSPDTVERAARIIEDFLIPHAREFYSLGAGSERPRSLCSYILTCGRDRQVPSDFAKNVQALRSLTAWELGREVSSLPWRPAGSHQKAPERLLVLLSE